MHSSIVPLRIKYQLQGLFINMYLTRQSNLNGWSTRRNFNKEPTVKWARNSQGLLMSFAKQHTFPACLLLMRTPFEANLQTFALKVEIHHPLIWLHDTTLLQNIFQYYSSRIPRMFWYSLVSCCRAIHECRTKPISHPLYACISFFL